MSHAAFGDFGSGNTGTAVGTDFSYLPLLPGLKEIRLLELEDAESCRQLRNVPLNSAPIYYALSYTWGDSTPVAPYSVDGKKILISESLSAALSRIFTFWKEQNRYTSNDEGRRLHVWADAICIDQRSPEEKASQVTIMGEIYKRAKIVMVYLGEDTENQDSGAAMSIISSWAECYDQYHHREYDPGSDRGYGKSFEKLPRLSYDNHLASFFERPWWNRI